MWVFVLSFDNHIEYSASFSECIVTSKTHVDVFSRCWHERFCMTVRYETEAPGNSEMAVKVIKTWIKMWIKY